MIDLGRRTTRSRNLVSNDLPFIANADWMRSSSLWWPGISRMSPWKRYACTSVQPPLMTHNDTQNLRDEVAMDVDEDDEGTQRVKRVPDHGIEVDFDGLKDEDREVSPTCL